MTIRVLKVYRNRTGYGSDHHRRSRRSGFSILELILALGIAAVMAGSVFMVYANAVRLETRSRELNEITFRSYMIFKTIEDDIGRAIAYRFRASDGNGDVPSFAGETDRLAFVTQTPDGLRWIEYSFKEASDGVIRTTVMGRRYSKNEDQVLEENVTDTKSRSLLRKQSLFDSSSPDSSRKEGSEVVVSGLYPEDISFHYGSSQKSTGIVWKDAWDGPDLPSALRVDVKFSQGPSDRVSGYSKVIVLPAGF